MLTFPNQKSRRASLCFCHLPFYVYKLTTSHHNIPGFSPSLFLQLWSFCAEMEEERLQSLGSASLTDQTNMLSPAHPAASEANTNSFFS